MTKKQIELVRESFEVIRGNSGPVAMLFYGRLFDLDPKLRPLFKTEMREQSRKLMDMLASIVEHLDSLERVRPQLRELGNKHVGYGVRPEHYETLAPANRAPLTAGAPTVAVRYAGTQDGERFYFTETHKAIAWRDGRAVGTQVLEDAKAGA